jgi:hypothetical protein
MKATEISEASKINLPEIAQSDHGVWYAVPVRDLESWYRKTWAAKARLDVDPAITYLVFVQNGQPVWGSPGGYPNMSLALHNGKLSSILSNSSFYNKSDQDNLTALVQATNAQSGERVWGNFIIYKGHVYDQDEFPVAMPKVGEISTGAVYEIPSDVTWALNKLKLKYQVSAHRVVMFKTTAKNFGDSWGAASIRDGKISDIQTQRPLDKVTQLKLGKEVAQALGLVQKVTVNTHIIPESKLHDTLRAISDHPGVDRPDLYWKVLKQQKMPAYQTNADVASELVKLGLVHEDTSTSQRYYTLTPIGKLVLARVNSGKSVAKASLIK